MVRQSVNLKQRRLAPEEFDITLRFGAGIHSRASSDEIDLRECSLGQNFALDLENREFTPRKPFKLLGTVPNAQPVRGFAQLLKSNQQTSMLVQGGNTVYEWDGTTFTSVGTVNAGANLRGRLSHNWQLDDKVLITDLSLQQTVMEWDGTTFQPASLNGVTDFRAKYCFVENERAFFANLRESGVLLPHVIAASKGSDFQTLSVSDVPSSALSINDPFQLLSPDLRGINGLVEAFGLILVSTQEGSLFKITGNSAKTDETGFEGFSIDPFYPRSGASGAESVAFVGNDIYYGRAGRIESVARTDKFGDVETDDLSIAITDQIETFRDWTTVYNSRLQRVYFYPATQSQVWVLHKSLVPTALSGAGQAPNTLSPWSKWTTVHSSSFQPTAIMNMLDPTSNDEFVYFGDPSGNFYQLEGIDQGDAGSEDIATSRTSRVFTVPLDTQAGEMEGWIKYRPDEAATLTLSLLYQGQTVISYDKTLDMATSNGDYFGGAVYFGGDFYYGTAVQELTRQKFTVPGQSNEFQVKLDVTGTTNFRINEVGLRFKAAS